MCGPMEIFSGISAIGSLLGATKKSSAAAPAPQVQAPVAPPASQAAQTPVESQARKGLPGGVDPTALTGALGIPSDKLTLGKSTVLGS